MKRLILDTNIIIKNPEILKRWSPNYRIIIPDVVLQELGNVSSKVRDYQNIKWTYSEALEKGFIHIVDIKKYINKLDPSIQRDYGISDVDYLIAQFAKEYSKQWKDTYLITEDRRLLNYAKTIGLSATNLFGLQNIILGYKTVSFDDLGKGQSIRQFQLKHLIISFASGIILSILSYFVYTYRLIILETSPIWLSVVGLIIIAFIFYWFRSNLRIAYSIVEFSFGFYAAFHSINRINFDFSNISNLSFLIPLIGGIYVMVRGLDNFSKGIQGTIIEKYWKRVFKE